MTTITELKSAKYKLERELRELLSNRIKEFYAETGIFPEFVNVRLVKSHLHLIGVEECKFDVAEVDLDIRL